MLGPTQRTLMHLLGVVTVFLVSAGAAVAAPAQRAVGNLSSGPSNIAFNARRAANVPPSAAKGQFTAHGSFGTLSVFTLHGPVTCLDVRGDRAGLFYPVTSSSPPLFSMLHGGVFIYVQLNRAGKPQSMGFVPVPFSHTRSCAPGPAPLPVTSGSAKLRS